MADIERQTVDLKDWRIMGEYSSGVTFLFVMATKAVECELMLYDLIDSDWSMSELRALNEVRLERWFVPFRGWRKVREIPVYQLRRTAVVN